MSEYSESAKAYVETERKKLARTQALWMDVAAAYDAGMRHGLQARRSAIRQLDHGPKCVICGFTAGMAIHVSTHLYGKPLRGGLEYHEFKSEKS